uniref:C-type lectin domain-containing protein n=1 Tax=Neogobius melanostomus TaxID=47308 RepID=A0A8C6UNX3_9GOBI
SSGSFQKWLLVNHVTITSLSSAVFCGRHGPAPPAPKHKKPFHWADALTYCRTHHTDLALIESAEENTAAINVGGENGNWIGLFRSTGKWSDNRTVAFTAWYHKLSGSKVYHKPFCAAQNVYSITPGKDHLFCNSASLSFIT